MAAWPVPAAQDRVEPGLGGRGDAFQAAVVKPSLGDKAELTETEWTGIGTAGRLRGLGRGETRHHRRELGAPRIREILAGKGREALAALIVRDKAEETKVNAIAAVEKLVRYHRDLYLPA